ncbi:protein FAM107B [Etheostoma spectabile]|uniref:protein FAM107B n=1 Tax=Etheostoma spectabile TaxID=54343 RepID=UPI0013AE88DA|nr:protein FAM107B-like [Etheostoma spectabile]
MISSSDNVVKAEASSGQPNPIKASRTHNELHKELLLAQRLLYFFFYGLRGLALSSRSELQQVLERRKRVQSEREEEGQSRTSLEDVLLRQGEEQDKVQQESQLMEFVRVRQNLRKIHSAIQNKAANT